MVRARGRGAAELTCLCACAGRGGRGLPRPLEAHRLRNSNTLFSENNNTIGRYCATRNVAWVTTLLFDRVFPTAPQARA